MLNFSCIFSNLVSRLFICNSILFSKVWIIFTIIILNSFSGRLPISSLVCHVPSPAEYFSAFLFCLDYCVWGALSAGWFLLIVKSAPCVWGWNSGLSNFFGLGNLHLGSGGWSWISSLWSAMKCPVVSFVVSMGLAWLWAACLSMFRVVFLFFWRIRRSEERRVGKECSG